MYYRTNQYYDYSPQPSFKGTKNVTYRILKHVPDLETCERYDKYFYVNATVNGDGSIPDYDVCRLWLE
eukprot:UN23581